MKVTDRPVPAPGAGEILIAVSAAGINGADLAQRRGTYPPPDGASDIPGLEVAGKVAGLGAGVTGLSLGQRVCALLSGGGYAEFCTVPREQVLALPDSVDDISGAGIMETVATVWANVFEAGRLARGETLLVHGGASGIGTTAIQLAKAFGAKVVVTCGSDQKLTRCQELGADRAINHRSEDFAAILKSEFGGADVILDIIGGPYLEPNIRTLRPGGRLVLIAFGGGRRGELDIARVMTQRLTITGSTLRARPGTEKARLVAEVGIHVWPLLMSGQYMPVIDSVWPLEKAADAHRHMETSKHVGKIILSMTS